MISGSGRSTTLDDFSTFLHDHVTDLLEPIYSVSIGRRGSDFFNRWIELHYGDEAEQKVVYLKDGAHRGWHSTFARTD